MSSSTDYIFSLTTIPSRIAGLGPVIDRLHAQSLKPSEVVIYVPRSYRREEFRGTSLSGLPSNCRVVMVDEDLGPATKVLYALEDYPDMPVIYCDDDRFYAPQLAEKLVAMEAQNPGACVAACALPIRHYLMYYSFRKDWKYRMKRIASIGLYRPRRIKRGTRLDIVSGFAGVLVRSGAFADGVHDIPDNFWLVDDIWLSGHLALAGTPVLTPGNRLARSEAHPGNEHDALNQYVYASQGRERLDRDCIAHFQREYGIWRNTGGW